MQHNELNDFETKTSIDTFDFTLVHSVDSQASEEEMLGNNGREPQSNIGLLGISNPNTEGYETHHTARTANCGNVIQGNWLGDDTRPRGNNPPIV
jgi:hypothetical protein